MKLTDLQISDGKILKITSDLYGLNIILQDWQEQRWSLFFYEVISIQSFSVENEDLSHITISKKDTFKTTTLQKFSDEDPNDFYCYSFNGVWNEFALLKIIAKNKYKIEKVKH